MNKKWILIIIFVGFIITVSGLIGSEYYTAQPQFCGSCHSMEKPYNLWARSGHMDVKCLDCHFAPGKESFLMAKFRGLEHLIAFLSSSVNAAEDEKLSGISATGCNTSGCHIGDMFPGSQVNHAENMPSSHKPHEDIIIEGAALNCGICHFDMKSDKQDAISQEACYLCLSLSHVIKVAIK